ncbi:hypothetical protein QBC47DRAFT_355423 [Echria macrotheca]|uniref:Uncharacterized protein n=1 Tax=Echria macrotheca TaxID=438768 RepID=A0AAJ0BL12_9PEZI|nr:hypothetical protein QBC47DRAFT_355423 [Echria macrotheca]
MQSMALSPALGIKQPSVIPNVFQDPGVFEAPMTDTERASGYRGRPSAQATVRCAGSNQGQLNGARDFTSHNKPSENPGGNSGSSRKRKSSRAENHEKDDGDDEDPGSLARQPKKKLKIETSTRAFACPFVKRDPFNHQKCLGLKLGKLSYVKQHLLRCHCAETSCPRCGKRFPGENSTTEYNKHLNQEQICDRRSFSLKGKMPSDVRDKVIDEKSRKHDENGRKLEDEERWYRVYQMLFRGAERPQSPYAETPAVEAVQAFSISMRQNIGSEILRQVAHDRPHEDCIQLLQDIVSLFVRHLHENYDSPSAGDLSPVSGIELRYVPSADNATDGLTGKPSTAGSSNPETDEGPTSSRGALLDPSPTSTPSSHDISGPSFFTNSCHNWSQFRSLPVNPHWSVVKFGPSAYLQDSLGSQHELRAPTFDFAPLNNTWRPHAAGPMGQFWTPTLVPVRYFLSEAGPSSFLVDPFSPPVPNGFPGGIEHTYDSGPPSQH